VSVFVAETGSGKSTQIVQYLQTSGLFPGKIACTQPRRLAARSLSEYVAKQMNCKNGGLVASMVGGKAVKEETKIVFMTDFQLLKLCVSDPRLSEYNCIVVDEAHERNLHTDLIIVFSMISQKLMPKIPGRVYRVDVHYSDKKMDKSEKYFETAVDKVVELCLDRNVPHGNMLVFLTTPKDTENASALFQRKIGTQSKIPSYPLHGQLQPEDQQLAMEEVKDKNSRKVIFATNCAETSLTIPGVVVVVDSGLSKQNAFDPVRNMDALVVGEISRNSADQRKGRAGRTQNGCCYRLYTQAEYEAMSESTVPEIQRIDLSGVAIRILELGLNPLEFDYLTPPSRQGLNSAMSALEFIGAFSEGQLTELGKKIAKIPAEPRLAKMILLLYENNLAMEGMVLASLITLSGQVFFRGKTDAERQDATKTKEFYASDDGDLLTSLQVFKDWRSRPDNLRTKWSVKNCVNNKSMRSVNEKVADLQRAIKYDLKMQVSETFSDDRNFASAVQECIYRVFSDKLCAYSGNPRIGFVEVSTGQLLKIHPSSVFSNAVNIPVRCVHQIA
uniref:RNA helicase n=1 Tax=Macrostomum lignano TaxID=282301 RepID=A0A1I8FYZ4_9PLAT